jgi:hypothetical protein
MQVIKIEVSGSPIMQPLTQHQLDQLQVCLHLAQDPTQHTQATEAFSSLQSTVSEDPAKALLNVLWKEILTARRSAAFWQQLSNVEKEVSERLAQNHIQLQQNYLRLVREQ